MSELGESAGPPPSQAGPDSEGVSPFAGGRAEGALCPGASGAGQSFLLPKHFPACIPPHPRLGQGWGAWQVRKQACGGQGEKKKLSHVGHPLCARHHAEHPCALDLSTLVKEGPPRGMRMGALE